MQDMIAWPIGSHLAPRSVMMRPVNTIVTGPVTLSGDVQRARSNAGRWELTVSGIPVGGPADVNAWDAFLASMEGGARGVYVPLWQYDQAPWPSAGSLAGNTNADNSFTGGYYFTGGYGFYNPAIKTYLNGPHYELDTQITVTVTAAGTIRAGMKFSLLGERVHVIREKISATVWGIWPPLRRDYVSGVALEFGRPKIKAVMMSPLDGGVDLGFGRYGQTTITFRELI